MVVFIFSDCLILIVLENSSGVAISRPYFGINIPSTESSVLLPTRVNQASVLEKSNTHVSTFRFFVKPAQGALKGS